MILFLQIRFATSRTQCCVSKFKRYLISLIQLEPCSESYGRLLFNFVIHYHCTSSSYQKEEEKAELNRQAEEREALEVSKIASISGSLVYFLFATAVSRLLWCLLSKQLLPFTIHVTLLFRFPFDYRYELLVFDPFLHLS